MLERHFYKERGQGAPIIFVHGIGARHSTWDLVIENLSVDHRCIAYDLRGHGRSVVPQVPFTLDDLVDDVADLQTTLGIDRAHVVGHSLGGMIGPAYARRYPDRVESLGLISTAAFRTADDRSRVLAVVENMETNGIESSLDTLANRWFTDDFRQQKPERVRARAQQVLETPPEVFLNVFRIYAETEMGPWLNEIDKPALIITGEDDPGCSPRLNQQIAAALPRSQLVVLAGMKHAVPLEAPTKIGDDLRRFISACA
jgi:3-oxoadipate enol-lactonase